MFEAEKYENGVVVPSGRPLRQFIHGGLGYDDPIEVFDGVRRYYPILDEAGNGSLQAVVDESGKLVSRSIIADPYGEDAQAINGPAVDKITIQGTKDSLELKISLHLTEPIDPSTITNVRLVPTTATPTASDPYTITWTINGAVTTNLSVEGVETLRSQTFGPAAPVLFSGFTVSATDIAQRFASTPAGSTFTSMPYNIHSLALLGTREPTDVGSALVMSPFKAHPYTDPFTKLDYVRARWMDRRTGTFLSPDPVGYRDSANLYAFCASDPVNNSDPTGQITIIVHGTFAANEQWWDNGSFAVSADAEVGDVWKIKTAGHRDVSQVPELRVFGPRGRFAWSGGNTRDDRLAGAQALADYINTIRRLYPNEPVNVITHSHGGNVAFAATNTKLVLNPAEIDRLAVLAKPYFSCAQDVALNESGTGILPCRGQDRYAADFSRIKTTILNGYSNEDRVQTLAALRNYEGVVVNSTRTDLHAKNAATYVNVRIPTFVGGLAAHSVQHNTMMGRAIGRYFASGGASSSDWIKAGQGTGLFANWLYQTTLRVTPAANGSNVGIYLGWEMGQ
jgi:RHS repeat-associated protein